MIKQTFGSRLKQARTEQNFTSEMLAEKCNLNAVFIRQMESGIRHPSVSTLIKLCNILQVSPEFLLKDELEINEDDSLEYLFKRIRSLSSEQLELLIPTVATLIDHMV